MREHSPRPHSFRPKVLRGARLFLLALIPFFGSTGTSCAASPLRVGVYQNSPLVFYENSQAAPQGLYIDILEHVARKEGWRLRYVRGSFEQCLELLEAGRLDLMTAIAYSPQRALRFTFTNETILSNWGCIYGPKGTRIQSILDLQGLRVAALRGDIYYEAFRKFAGKFGVDCRFVEVAEYGEVFRALERGEADAGIITRLYGIRFAKDYEAVRTPIVFSPVELRFALPKGSKRGIAQALDRHLKALKKDPASAYYLALDRWLGTPRVTVFPRWLPWLLAGAVLALLVAAALGVIFRRQVRLRTAELTRKTGELEREIAERALAEEALRKSEQRYRILVETMTEGISMIDAENRFAYVNERFCEMVGTKREDLLGRPARDLLDSENRKILDRQIALRKQGAKEPYELTWTARDGRAVPTRMSPAPLFDEDGNYAGAFAVVRDLTLRKQAKAALREAEEKYRVLAENATDAILMIQDGRTIYRNPAYQELIGYSVAETKDRSFLDLVAPEDRDMVREYHEKRLRGEPVPDSYEATLISRQGKRITMEIRARGIEFQGRPATIGILRDITQRKQYEEALKESEARYRSVFENAGTAMVIVEQDTTITMANRAFEEMSGYAREEMEGKISWVQFVHPEEKERMLGFFRQRQEGPGEPPGRYDLRTVDRHGNVRHVFLRVSPIPGTTRSVAALMDLTDRDRAEEALRESEEKFRTIAESAQDAIIMMDEEGRVSYWNRAAQEVFGVPESEALGRDLHAWLAPPRFREAYRRAFPRFREKGKGGLMGGAVELAALDKEGREFPIELSVSSVRIGGRWQAVGIIRNISDRKRIEARLRQAQKMEAIGTLAGGIAHDFNNILASIMGYTELAKLEVAEGTKARSALDHVYQASLRARDLVTQILTFSRQHEEEKRPLQVGPIIKEAVKLLRASLPSTVQIRARVERDLGSVVADPTQIHQVLMNLCTNAGHAMSEGGGVLEVEVENVRVAAEGQAEPSADEETPTLDPGATGLEAGLYVRIRVSDTGHGMAPEVLERIFDPYFTTKDKGVGTGLGLAVVQGIVESYGGRITVQSTPGEGSAFDVFLPALAPEAAEPAERSAEVIPRGTERILYVDDEPTIVDVGKQMLERLGYRVTTRTSSVEALALFQERPDRFDVVITDLTMPQMTGDRLARELLRIRPEIPVILCTGFSEKISPERSDALGVKAFVLKPITIMALAKTVRAVLDGT